MANKIKFNINGDTFNSFVSKLSDLSSIDDSVRLKIDKDDVLMYSILGNQILLAFKNFLIPTKDLIDVKDDMDYQLDLVIPNVKKFVKNLSLIKDVNKVSIEFNYKESSDDDSIYLVRYFQIACGRFKINWVGGEHNNETREINKEMLEKNLNIKNMEMAKAEDVKQITGYTIGGVSPVGHLKKVNIYIDKNLDRFKDLYAAAGHPNCVFKISFINLVQITNGSILDITE